MYFSFKKYTWIGIVFSITAGVLLHFLYEWTGRNPVVGAFSPVNESVWEHLKLLFFPCLIFFLWEYKKDRRHGGGLITRQIRGLLLGLLLILCGYYTYNGILGHDLVPADILLFVGSVLITYLYGCRGYAQHQGDFSLSAPFLLILLVLLASFILFTYFPIHIPLFMDPQTFTFGISSGLLTY